MEAVTTVTILVTGGFYVQSFNLFRRRRIPPRVTSFKIQQ